MPDFNDRLIQPWSRHASGWQLNTAPADKPDRQVG